jgi:hypothetical protein
LRKSQNGCANRLATKRKEKKKRKRQKRDLLWVVRLVEYTQSHENWLKFNQIQLNVFEVKQGICVLLVLVENTVSD